MAAEPVPEPFARRIPKVELHLHLEGAIEAGTLARLREARGERVDAAAMRQLQSFYRHRDFRHFLENYRSVCAELQRPEDFGMAATALCERLARDNVRYAEVMCSPMIFTRRGLPIDEIMDALSRAARRYEGTSGVTLRYIFDGVRQWGAAAQEELVGLAESNRQYGVIGVGVGGDERSVPTSAFAEAFREARRLGLRTVIHAGELDGPRSVWEAIDILQVERIGHGIRAAEDVELVRQLAGSGLPLECCPTSNLKTGVIGSWSDHPIRRLHAAGVKVTVNSDDPAMFGTTLSDEWEALEQRLDLARPEVVGIGLNTIDASFLDPDTRARLSEEMRRAAAAAGCPV